MVMPYTLGFHDYARLRNYAESQLDILRMSQVNEAMLTKLFGMKKLSECPVVRNKNFKDEIMEKIFRQDRDFDYGRLKPSPTHIVVEDAHFPRCMCQEFCDDNGRRLKIISFYQVHDAQQMGEAASEQVGAYYRLSADAKKQISEQIASQFEKMKPRLDSFTIFYGDWKHYDESVLAPGSEKFEGMKGMVDDFLKCPRILDNVKGELFVPSDASGFLLDQLF